MALSRAWAKRATVNTDKTGYTSPIGPPCPGDMSVCLQDGPSGLFGLQAVCGAFTAFVRQPVFSHRCAPCPAAFRMHFYHSACAVTSVSSLGLDDWRMCSALTAASLWCGVNCWYLRHSPLNTKGDDAADAEESDVRGS